MHSPLTNKIMLASPYNYSVGRSGYKICKITPHHMAGVLTAEQCAATFQNPNRGASANYCIGYDGTIVCNVDEVNRAWTSSNGVNDCQAITIEVSNSQAGGNWPISEASWNSLVNLCVDICQRYGFKLTFDGTSNGSLTMHKMFASTSCPGPYLESRMSELAATVNARLDGGSAPSPTPTPSTEKYGVGTQCCTNTLATSSTGGKVYKGDWEGTITKVVPGAPYPYLLNDGTGWTNDTGIDTDPHVPGQTGADQILTVGSVVTSVAMAIKTVGNSAIKTVNGVQCVNIPALNNGKTGWFPTQYVSEYDASDGAKDNYLANDKAKVYVDQCTVEAINIPYNLAQIHGIWVSATPLTELVNGK